MAACRHPDKQYGDEKSREFAAELSRLANEAANVARKQAAEAAAKAKRIDAYDTLQALLNGSSDQGIEQLRAAIQTARDAGVSEIEIAKAEARLGRMDMGRISK